MRLKNIIYVISACILVFAGCGQKDEIPEPVVREEVVEGVYTNTELGISLVLPDGWTALTRERLDNLENPGVAMKYDMLILNTDLEANIILGTDALENLDNADTMTAEEYLAVVKDDLTRLQSDTHTVGASENRTISGREFFVLSVQTSEGFNQDYCAVKQDDIMVVIVATYREKDAEPVTSILENIIFEK